MRANMNPTMSRKPDFGVFDAFLNICLRAAKTLQICEDTSWNIAAFFRYEKKDAVKGAAISPQYLTQCALFAAFSHICEEKRNGRKGAFSFTKIPCRCQGPKCGFPMETTVKWRRGRRWRTWVRMLLTIMRGHGVRQHAIGGGQFGLVRRGTKNVRHVGEN